MQTITKRLVSMTGALFLVAGATAADAAPHRGVIIVPRVGIYRPYLYAPYWGPWHPYAYGYPYAVRPDASIRTKVDPNETEIYLDGYFAGYAREFDGGRPLHVTPGGHAVTMHLAGYRTVTEELWVEPSKTVTLKASMERLVEGEASTPVPPPAWPEPWTPS